VIVFDVFRDYVAKTHPRNLVAGSAVSVHLVMPAIVLIPLVVNLLGGDGKEWTQSF